MGLARVGTARCAEEGVAAYGARILFCMLTQASGLGQAGSRSTALGSLWVRSVEWLARGLFLCAFGAEQLRVSRERLDAAWVLPSTHRLGNGMERQSLLRWKQSIDHSINQGIISVRSMRMYIASFRSPH